MNCITPELQARLRFESAAEHPRQRNSGGIRDSDKIAVLEVASMAEFFSLAEPVIRKDSATYNRAEVGYWAGLGEQSKPAFYAAQGSDNALEAFRAAQASLDHSTLPGSVQARPNGGAWVIPEVIKGAPLPARVRIRDRLAPKRFAVRIECTASVNFQVIAESAAKIARAAWDYTMRGGVAIVEASYFYCFAISNQQTGAKGLLIRVTPTLSSEWEIANAISVQAYRPLGMNLAIAMSGLQSDDIPVLYVIPPKGTATLHGTSADADSLRDVLGIA